MRRQIDGGPAIAVVKHEVLPRKLALALEEPTLRKDVLDLRDDLDAVGGYLVYRRGL